jgi:polysaccharide biosynthesis/export protein
MKVKHGLVVAIVFACVLAGVAGLSHAQEPQQQPQQPSSTTPSTGPQQQMPSSIDIQGSKIYLLGPGDVLEVRVFGQPDLSSSVEVDSDGNLSSLPFLETPILAKCRTDKQIQKDVALAYAKFINNPQVSVTVSQRNSRAPATVFGAVRTATRVEMKRKVRLNELIAVAGGFTERASGTIQILHTEPLMCPGPGEEELAKPIDGTKIPLQVVKIQELRVGKAEANPIIRPGDYVQVTEADPVYITGAVVAPTGVFLRDQLTLTRALAMVGGTRKEAKLSDVRIFRQVPGSMDQEILHFDLGAIRKKEKPDVLLQPFDVIEVPEAGMFSSSRIGTTVMSALTGGFTSLISNTGTYLPARVLY